MTIVLIRDNRSVVPDQNSWHSATNYHINTRGKYQSQISHYQTVTMRYSSLSVQTFPTFYNPIYILFHVWLVSVCSRFAMSNKLFLSILSNLRCEISNQRLNGKWHRVTFSKYKPRGEKETMGNKERTLQLYMEWGENLNTVDSIFQLME